MRGIHKKGVIEYAALFLLYVCNGIYKHISSEKRISARLL